MARPAAKSTGNSAAPKKRGRKKLEVSSEAQKKLQEIAQRAARERDLILAAERSKAIKSTVEEAIAKLQTIIATEGKVKLSNQPGKAFFVKGMNIKIDLRDENGKTVKAALDNITGK